MLLKNKKIILGITGSIAAYKSILLLRLLVKEGAEVKVVMTTAAKDFISPLVLSVLSGNKVITEFTEDNEWNNHVALGRWADLFLIAPLSCNTLAKMAAGICDNILMAVYLSAICPILVAPAMDEDMWHHPATKRNINTIIENGNSIIDVVAGELASGLTGEGRMAEPEMIFTHLIEKYFRGEALLGKKIMVTAGPTYEPIDPVRYIGNRSSGKMGYALAEAFYLQGAEVILISGPSKEKLSYSGIRLIKVETAKQMYDECIIEQDASIIVMSAAVADFRPKNAAAQKLKKSDMDVSINLEKTTDILGYLGDHKKTGQVLVGFALETENEKENAGKKLMNKNLDCIFLNSLQDEGAGFDKDTNRLTMLDKDGLTEWPLETKKSLAGKIVVKLIQKYC